MSSPLDHLPHSQVAFASVLHEQTCRICLKKFAYPIANSHGEQQYHLSIQALLQIYEHIDSEEEEPLEHIVPTRHEMCAPCIRRLIEMHQFWQNVIQYEEEYRKIAAQRLDSQRFFRELFQIVTNLFCYDGESSDGSSGSGSS